MNIIEHLKKLDDLIVRATTPPATSKLRNYLSTIIEQAETEGHLPDVMAQKDAANVKTVADLQSAHIQTIDQKDKTIAYLQETSFGKIAALQKENSDMKNEIKKLHVRIDSGT